MKKSLFLFAASLGIFGTAMAQTPTITNGSFETWSTVSAPMPLMPSLERPTGWYGSDQTINHTVGPLLMLSGADFDSNKQLFKDTDKHEGDFAAKLMTKDFGDTLGVLPVLMTNAKQTLNMSALTGGMDNVDLMSIFKFSEQTALYGKRIDSVTAYVKTPASNVDSSAAFVMAYKKITNDSSAVIGQGGVTFAPNSNGYVKITIPVIYSPIQILTEATDSMVVGFSSSGLPSGATFHIDNTLFVDHVELYVSEPTSVGKVNQIDLGFQVYPNPAVNNINFDNKANAKNTVLIIQNAVGKVMHYAPLAQGVNQIDLGKYAAGTYFYEIFNQNGTGKQTGKFVK